MANNEYDPNGMPEPGQTVKFYTFFNKQNEYEIAQGEIISIVRYQKKYPESKVWYIMGIIIKPTTPFCNSDWIFRELNTLPYK